MLNRDPSVVQPAAAEGAVALPRSSRRTRAHLFPVLVLAAALPYANTLRNGFVYVDWIAGVTDLEVTFFCVLTFWFFLGLSRPERAFKSAEALDPSNSRAHIILGMLYADAGRTSEAAREYQAVLQIDPTNVQAREALTKLGSQPPDAKSSKP